MGVLSVAAVALISCSALARSPGDDRLVQGSNETSNSAQLSAGIEQQVNPTATPAPTTETTALSQEEAQSVVRDWFDALAAEDYQRAESLTAGSATESTRQLVDTIQRETAQRNVAADIVVQQLELSPAAQPQAGQAVRSDFNIDVNATTGPFTLPGQNFQGSATFIVQQTENGAMITEIRDITGLPIQ